jgi:hypothetical protein
MANVYAVANGNWSAGATWNTGSVPTSADDVFANNFTVNVDVMLPYCHCEAQHPRLLLQVVHSILTQQV